MSAFMTSSAPCACDLDRNALLERANAGEGVLALLLPLSPPAPGLELPIRCENRESVSARSIPAPAPVSAGALAERFTRLRRKRDSIFGDRLFADPAWDMMLDLFQASKKDSRPISVTSLCIASAVPNTTALRWIDALVQKGLLARQADVRDGRRTFVSLTQEASRKMEEVLGSWTEAG